MIVARCPCLLLLVILSEAGGECQFYCSLSIRIRSSRVGRFMLLLPLLVLTVLCLPFIGFCICVDVLSACASTTLLPSLPLLIPGSLSLPAVVCWLCLPAVGAFVVATTDVAAVCLVRQISIYPNHENESLSPKP